MKVLIACEYSGTVRDAFIQRGHDAISCDLLPTDSPGPHHQGDIFDIINDGFDLMIAHPPCTHLAVSGAKHFAKKIADGRQQEGIDFFMRIASSSIPKYAIENPVCIMSRIWRKPDQYIQPYEYGHEARKKTGLWLKNLPHLVPTKLVEPKLITYKDGSVFSADYGTGFSKGAGKRRSKFYKGIAEAMAEQWGNK